MRLGPILRKPAHRGGTANAFGAEGKIQATACPSLQKRLKMLGREAVACLSGAGLLALLHGPAGGDAAAAGGPGDAGLLDEGAT